MRWQQKGIIVKLNVSIMPAIQCTHKTTHTHTHTNTFTHTGAQQCPQSYSPWKHLADKKRLRKDVLLRTDNGGGVWVESEPARRKGRGACQPCHTHKNKCTIPEQQKQQQLHNGNERLKLSSWQKERKANQLEGLPWEMKARPQAQDQARACLLPDKRNNMHVFYGNSSPPPPLLAPLSTFAIFAYIF